MPAWVKEVVPDQRGHYWAPDVIHHNGRYCLYYSVSSFGKNSSAIALATNQTLDPDDPKFKWTDEGIVVRSRRGDDFNAIDPAVIRTSSGELWMSFGSFWNGLKLMQLDRETGKRLSPVTPLHSIAHYQAIEAPYIFERDGWFHLFVNWDACCKGVNSTYNIRVGRSRAIEGPYLDKDGVDLAKGDGSLLLETDGPFIGPGHANVFEENGAYWFHCHFYDGTRRGSPTLAIRPLQWDDQGWPELRAAAQPVVIGLIGDSTVADTYGWGPALAKRCKPTATVLNYAKNGATPDSLSRRLDALLEHKPDHVLVQFGHNDMKKYDAKAYGAKLASYVKRIRKAGGRPVVLSSVTRRHFDDSGKIAPRVVEGDRALPGFAGEAKAVARRENVPFIDLNAISIRHHNEIGPDASAAYNFKETDRTHFSPEGAAAIAGLIIAELKTAAPELAVHLKWPVSKKP